MVPPEDRERDVDALAVAVVEGHQHRARRERGAVLEVRAEGREIDRRAVAGDRRDLGVELLWGRVHDVRVERIRGARLRHPMVREDVQPPRRETGLRGEDEPDDLGSIEHFREAIAFSQVHPRDTRGQAKRKRDRSRQRLRANAAR